MGADVGLIRGAVPAAGSQGGLARLGGLRAFFGVPPGPAVGGDGTFPFVHDCHYQRAPKNILRWTD